LGSIAQEDVDHRVAVARGEIGRGRAERRVATVGAHGRARVPLWWLGPVACAPAPWFVSLAARHEAPDSNETPRPSALIAGAPLRRSPSAPELLMLILSVAPVVRSWTKMWETPFVSPATRSEDGDVVRPR
jgi:hypothetical protein